MREQDLLPSNFAAKRCEIGNVRLPTPKFFSFLCQNPLRAQRNINLDDNSQPSLFRRDHQWSTLGKHRIQVRGIAKAAASHRPAKRIRKTN